MSIIKVAELAGVSNSTVSRVINNHPRVAPETAKAVRAAMQSLKYTPSDRRPGPKPGAHARNSALTIAFFVLGARAERATPAFADLLRAVSTSLAQRNSNLVFMPVVETRAAIARLADQRVDGVILHGAPPDAELHERLRSIPTVWLMGNRSRPHWGDQVMPDSYTIGDLAVRYLASRGHKELAFLNLDEGHWTFRVAGHSFQATAEELGLRPRIVAQARQEPEEGYWPRHPEAAVEKLVQSYVALKPRPTGLFIADDMQVALLQPALQRHGVQIGPGKVEVVSCNNEQPFLVGLHPRPAVVDIRIEAVGRLGVDRLIWRIEHRDVAERLVTVVEPFVIDHDGKAVENIENLKIPA